MRKVKLPYNLNVFSQEAALVALENEALMQSRVDATLCERARVTARLGAIPGIEVFPSRSNFVAFRVEGSADEVFEGLVARGTLIRNISRYPRMERCLRVSIGERDKNDRFLDALEDLMGPGNAQGATNEGAES
jgi:histidinol-phosphate aminotransferase